MLPGETHHEGTVAIPTRDRWPLLQQAVKSALQQEDAELEVIVEARAFAASLLRPGSEALHAHLKKIETANVTRERFVFFDGLGDWNRRLKPEPAAL